MQEAGYDKALVYYDEFRLQGISPKESYEPDESIISWQKSRKKHQKPIILIFDEKNLIVSMKGEINGEKSI